MLMWRCWRHPYPCAMRYSSALAPAMARNGSFVGGGSELASLLLPIEASRQRSHPLESLPIPDASQCRHLGGLRCRCADLKIFSPNKVHANHPPKKENDEFLYVFMPPFPLSHWVPLVSRQPCNTDVTRSSRTLTVYPVPRTHLLNTYSNPAGPTIFRVGGRVSTASSHYRCTVSGVRHTFTFTRTETPRFPIPCPALSNGSTTQLPYRRTWQSIGS